MLGIANLENCEFSQTRFLQNFPTKHAPYTMYAGFSLLTCAEVRSHVGQIYILLLHVLSPKHPPPLPKKKKKKRPLIFHPWSALPTCPLTQDDVSNCSGEMWPPTRSGFDDLKAWIKVTIVTVTLWLLLIISLRTVMLYCRNVKKLQFWKYCNVITVIFKVYYVSKEKCSRITAMRRL